MKPKRKPEENEIEAITPPDLLSLYAASVIHCLLTSIAKFNSMPLQQSFDNYWRSIPSLADACSVNPQLSLRSIPTKSQTNLFYIENMDTKSSRLCQIVSANNAVELDSEKELLKQNPYCKIYLSDKSFEEENEERFTKKIFEVIPVDESAKPNQIGLNELLEKTNSNDPFDVLIIGKSNYDLDFAELFLKKSGTLNSFVFCQINLMVREPRSQGQQIFIDFVNKLIEDNRYLLMKAEKDRYSLHMQLFFVNHEHPFCRRRYIRRYTYD